MTAVTDEPDVVAEPLVLQNFVGGRWVEASGEATVDDYVKAGWDPEDVKTYTQAYYDTFYAPTMLTYLRIPGTFEYWDILDKNLSTSMAGGMSAKEALDATAAAWEQVTDRIGRDSQLRSSDRRATRVSRQSPAPHPI